MRHGSKDDITISRLRRDQCLMTYLDEFFIGDFFVSSAAIRMPYKDLKSECRVKTNKERKTSRTYQLFIRYSKLLLGSSLRDI
jgi:hypothetical protein